MDARRPARRPAGIGGAVGGGLVGVGVFVGGFAAVTVEEFPALKARNRSRIPIAPINIRIVFGIGFILRSMNCRKDAFNSPPIV